MLLMVLTSLPSCLQRIELDIAVEKALCHKMFSRLAIGIWSSHTFFRGGKGVLLIVQFGRTLAAGGLPDSRRKNVPR